MTAMGGGSSPYMKELAEKLAFVKAEVLGLFNVSDLSWEWCVLSAEKQLYNLGLTTNTG